MYIIKDNLLRSLTTTVKVLLPCKVTVIHKFQRLECGYLLGEPFSFPAKHGRLRKMATEWKLESKIGLKVEVRREEIWFGRRGKVIEEEG